MRFILTIVLSVMVSAHTVFTQDDIDINSYVVKGVPVIAMHIEECSAALRVLDASKFKISDRVLIYQAKGMKLSLAANDSGIPTDMGFGGNFEFATVGNIEGDTIFLRSNLSRNYDVEGSVQLVPVISGRRVRIFGPVTAEEFDGYSGGVVAIEATDTLFLNGIVDVSGKGFRGGQVSGQYDKCLTSQMLSSSYPSNFYGQKGEGAAVLPIEMLAGRAAQANGGGGGANHNAGGGGGGNGGGGGLGGAVYGVCGLELNGGLGGNSLQNDIKYPRIFFGGGGGGGHQNENLGSEGGNGGGCIIISAPVFIGNGIGSDLLANGTGAQTASHDGAGGGGAGGSVFLGVGLFDGNTVVESVGGKGGNLRAVFLRPHGPGGGGAGGQILFSAKSRPTNIELKLSGGKNGTNADYSVEPELSWYATSGQDGMWFTDCVFDTIRTKNFSTVVNDYQYVGSARYSDGKVILTDTLLFQAGAVWAKEKFNVSSSFDTRFGFSIYEGNDHELRDGGSPGADGVALVLSGGPKNQLGENGMGIGYSGIDNAIAVEFDSYLNGAFSDPSASHVAVQVSNKKEVQGIHQDPYLRGITFNGVPNLVADSSIYHARVRVESGLLSVWLSKNRSLGEPILTVPLNIESELKMDADGMAWIGITSATGFSSQFHELTYWSVIECRSLLSTAIEEDVSANEELILSIAPNPSSDRAKLTLSRIPDERTSIVIYNSNGELVWRQVGSGVSAIQLPVQALSSGLYLIQVVYDGNVETKMWSIIH
ncbi:MAG: T9SS type A sorting domain-containing protein [Ignavibacteria bacterium]|nr:T9SS type A sorting domain-containing protein [Ignavibacteria bacterium]